MRVIRAFAVGSAAVAALIGPVTIAHAQTFAADLIVTRADGRTDSRSGRVYASHDKVRIETPDFADSFFVVDGDREAAWFVRPRQWVFMDARQSSPVTQVFVAVDPRDPCPTWQKMSSIAGALDQGTTAEWQCRLVGAETIAGRQTLRYSVVSSRNQRSDRWIDVDRGFPIRLRAQDGTVFALQHIVDQPQPGSLFVIPPTYKKFDPMQLIQQLMQSDVWVKPPPG